MVVGTVVQVTNVSASVTDKQLRDLFGIFGDVLELKLYPTASATSKPRIGFVKYDEHETCLVAQHLTNTILLDRPLVVTPVAADDVPDEKTALAASEPSEAAPSSFSTSALAATAQTMISQPPLMPTPMPTPMSMSMSMSAVPTSFANLTSLTSLNLATIQPMPGANPIMQCLSPGPVPCQLVTGMQAKAGMGRALWDAISALAPAVSNPPLPGMVPSAPPLGGNVDPSKIEEIRRTVYVGNLNTQLLGEALVPFFAAGCGEVMYVRMAGDETQPTRFVFIEFADVNAVNMALQYNGAMFGDRPLKVNHSKNAVVKPQVKAPDVGQREVMEAVRKAQAAISQQIEPVEEKKKTSSKTHSPSPQRHRSSRTGRRSGSRERRRSRSRERKRSTSRDRRERRRSGSRERRRDRPSSRYDRRDRDRDDTRRDRDRDDTRRRERSPAHRPSRRHVSRSPEKPERRRSRSRDRTERKRRRTRSRSVEAPKVTRRRSPSSSASPERPTSKKHKRRERSKERSTRRRQPSSSPPRPPPPTAAAQEDDESVSMSESD